jgi:hypothetical protein
MNIVKNKKGVARVIEALLASVLLMSCLSFVPVASNMNNSSGSLVSTARNTLLTLDSDGHLGALVDSGNWSELKACIALTLPLTTWFNLTVFDKNMNILNISPICNAGTISDKIVSLDYVCASQNATYTIYILRLQLSEVGSS